MQFEKYKIFRLSLLLAASFGLMAAEAGAIPPEPAPEPPAPTIIQFVSQIPRMRGETTIVFGTAENPIQGIWLNLVNIAHPDEETGGTAYTIPMDAPLGHTTLYIMYPNEIRLEIFNIINPPTAEEVAIALAIEEDDENTPHLPYQPA